MEQYKRSHTNIISSGATNLGRGVGGQETSHISRRLQGPIYFGLFVQGSGGPWTPPPPPNRLLIFLMIDVSQGLLSCVIGTNYAAETF